MLSIDYSAIEENLENYCNKASIENEMLVINMNNDKNIVIMSLEKWSLMEKELKNLEYLKKIDESLQQIKENKVVIKTMEELEEMENE